MRSMSMTSRLLLVDDEPQITRVLRTVFATQGYDVRIAEEADSALESFARWRPHLVMTDVCMPHMDGLALCRRIRATSNVPIIVVSVKNTEAAKVDAFDSGADDYVTKPFGVDELLARVRAALRRASADGDETAHLEVGDFRIDFGSRRVHIGGNEIRLTPKEFDLFVYLARHPNRVVQHRRLLTAVWGDDGADHPEYLRVFVGQLRKKIEPVPSSPCYLMAEPWIGYRFNPTRVTTTPL
jgi:two-component system KDP operon response regulator KdpE